MSLIPLFIAQPASASQEKRIKLETITVWVPKIIKAPKMGCKDVPVRFKWGYYFTAGATVTIYDAMEYEVGYLEIDSWDSGEAGLLSLKICSQRWTSEEGYVYFAAKRGAHTIEVSTTDFDNPKRIFFYDKVRKLRLR